MQPETMTTTAFEQRVVREARRLVGAHFQHQGRLPRVALDCWGIVFFAARNAGAAIDDFKGYSLPCDPRVLIEQMERQTEEASIEERHAGQLVVFWFEDRRQPQHMAVLTDRNRMVQIQDGQRASEIEIVPAMRGRIFAVRSFREAVQNG